MSKYLLIVWYWGVDISEVEEDDEEQRPEGSQHQAGQGRARLIRAEKIDENYIYEETSWAGVACSRNLYNWAEWAVSSQSDLGTELI